MFLFDFTGDRDGHHAPRPSRSRARRAARRSPATTTITASATDNVGVTKVEFSVDGKLVATDTSAPYSTSWNAAAATFGTHTLTAKAYDQAGNSATAAPVSVTVTDTTVPTRQHHQARPTGARSPGTPT